MAARLIRKTWWVDFRFNHTRHRIRSPENSRAGALAYEALLRQRLARGEDVRAVPASDQQEPTFGEFALKWFDDYVVANNKPSEQRRKRYVLNASLIPFFGKTPISKITTNDVERYKGWALKTGVANKTVNNFLGVFGKCTSVAYEWLELKGTPPKVKWLKCPTPQTDYLTPDECELLLSHSEGVVHELILTALKTGMRQGELKGLQWSSIDWESRSIAVRHSRCDYTNELGSPKNSRERHIPMDIGVHGALLRRKQEAGYVFLDVNGEPFNHPHLIRYLSGVCAQAGMRRIGWHTLRHTFASHLVMKGAPLPAVQALMGHSTIEMTMRYTHLAPATLRTAIDLLGPATALHSDFGQPVVDNRFESDMREAA